MASLLQTYRAESDKLPPTLGALKQHILRVHVQTRVWAQAAIALQDPQLDPLQNRYCKHSDGHTQTSDHRGPPSPKGLEHLRCSLITSHRLARSREYRSERVWTGFCAVSSLDPATSPEPVSRYQPVSMARCSDRSCCLNRVSHLD
ncbi:unnamed protein product [Leuciscus chuanchicus]